MANKRAGKYVRTNDMAIVTKIRQSQAWEKYLKTGGSNMAANLLETHTHYEKYGCGAWRQEVKTIILSLRRDEINCEQNVF